MGARQLSGEALREFFSRRECARRHPVQFWTSFVFGSCFALACAVTGFGWYQASTPIYRPTLQLISDVVPAGGYMGFIQAASSPRRCLQETSRAIWWWEDVAHKRRNVLMLTDANPAPRVWDGPIVLNIKLPEELTPGTYYYVRETASWCSMLSYIFNVPEVQRTNDVRFEIVSAVK